MQLGLVEVSAELELFVRCKSTVLVEMAKKQLAVQRTWMVAVCEQVQLHKSAQRMQYLLVELAQLELAVRRVFRSLYLVGLEGPGKLIVVNNASIIVLRL
jgi:hypothetical protein